MIEYRIDKTIRIIFTKVIDSTSVGEVIAHIQYLFNDPDFQPDYHVIVEIIKDTTIDPKLPEDTETAQRILSHYEEKRNGARCAIVIESETHREIVEYGLNLIDFSSSGIQILDNKDEALKWISVSAEGKQPDELG